MVFWIVTKVLLHKIKHRMNIQFIISQIKLRIVLLLFLLFWAEPIYTKLLAKSVFETSNNQKKKPKKKSKKKGFLGGIFRKKSKECDCPEH